MAQRALTSPAKLAVISAQIAFFALPVAARAQEASPAEPAAGQENASEPQTDQENDAGAIIVTAQRRSERLIDVPISITALNAERLDTSGIDSVRTLGQVTPGLLLLDAGQRLQPAIRGVQSQGTNAGEETNVSFYVDDVYIASQSSALFQLADTERVEVLKGPQGTLFGRNSTGGAIRITTRRPTSEPVVEARASYGFRQNDREFSLYAATPLGERFAVSFAGLVNDQDGFIDNLNPNANTGQLGTASGVSARARLFFMPNPNAEFALSFDIVDLREQGPTVIPIIAGRSVYRTRPGVIIPTQNFATAYSQEPGAHYKGWGVSLRSDLQFGDLTIRSVTAYRHAAVPEANNDVDRTNLSLQANAPTEFFTNSFSQDITLSHQVSGRFRWTAGVFYFQSRSSVGLINYNGDIAPQNILSGRIGVVETRAAAGYGEATFEITDEFSVTGGLRYSYEDKYYDYRSIFVANPVRFSADDHWSNLSFRAVAQYEPDRNNNFYISYSSGFKAGVFNTSVPEANAVEPETIYALEVGVKRRLGNGIFLTVAAFDYNYRNIQTLALIQDQLGTRNALANAASARIRGLELGFDAALGPIVINAGASWLPTARYSSFPSAIVYLPAANGGNTVVNGYDASGSRIVRAPKFTFNIGATYSTDLAGGTFRISANYAYNSGIEFGVGETSPYSLQPAYSLINGSVSWQTPGGRYRFTLFGENLTNRAYRTYIIQTANGDSGTFGRPMEIGIRVDARF